MVWGVKGCNARPYMEADLPPYMLSHETADALIDSIHSAQALRPEAAVFTLATGDVQLTDAYHATVCSPSPITCDNWYGPCLVLQK